MAKFVTKIASITKSVMIDIISRAERFGTIEFPKKKATPLLYRLIRAKTDKTTTSKVVKAFLDIAKSSLVASSDSYDGNPDSAVSAVQSIGELADSQQRVEHILQGDG